MRVDVMDVAEDRTAASQKRRGQSGEWSTNVAGKMMNALLSPRSSDPDHWWASIHHQLLSASYARALMDANIKHVSSRPFSLATFSHLHNGVQDSTCVLSFNLVSSIYQFIAL